eukprot:5495546-Amphidinium_carterae.1
MIIVAIVYNGGGETPLMLAAGQGHAEAVRHLLRHGARQTLALHSRVTGDTALHLAGFIFCQTGANVHLTNVPPASSPQPNATNSKIYKND